MNTAQALDHVGIAGAHLAVLSAAYERLGFTLTPPARHSGRRTPDGPIIPFGTGNRCAMLREGYLELIAIVDPQYFTNSLEFSLARYAGLHIIALGIDDEESNLARMRAAGIPITGIAYLERPVDDANPSGPQARFARLFDAFYTTKPGGMGLGLSICRSIIEAHWGRMWATPSVPNGVTFQFTLPRQGAP